MSNPARICFRSSDPRVAARWDADACGEDQTIASADDPLDVLQRVDADAIAARRTGQRRRWLGFVAYEANRFIESLPPRRRSADDLPLAQFWRACEPSSDVSADEAAADAFVISRSMTRATYLDAARRAIEYIRAGDAFQISLAQSFVVRAPLAASQVWGGLQRDSPATYGALIEFDGVAILSNSPELFFRIEPLEGGRRRITTRPIKGTRPRGPGMREALERSEKDRAELAMIVDLERNDLGRICEIGSVRVVEPRVIEEHATVYHGVATIEGLLRPDVTLADVFRAMFPCGSITGCPKVRSMQIIDELEPEPRGPYCGAIGVVDGDGSVEFSVAIRTMTLRDGVARVHVGGGIVADSEPVEEHRETIVKARAMLRALGVSDADIDALDDE